MRLRRGRDDKATKPAGVEGGRGGSRGRVRLENLEAVDLHTNLEWDLQVVRRASAWGAHSGRLQRCKGCSPDED